MIVTPNITLVSRIDLFSIAKQFICLFKSINFESMEGTNRDVLQNNVIHSKGLVALIFTSI